MDSLFREKFTNSLDQLLHRKTNHEQALDRVNHSLVEARMLKDEFEIDKQLVEKRRLHGIILGLDMAIEILEPLFQIRDKIKQEDGEDTTIVD